MSDLRKAAEMALESWGFFFSQAHPEIVGLMYGNDWAKIAKERTEALRQALAQPEWVGLSRDEVDYCFEQCVVRKFSQDGVEDSYVSIYKAAEAIEAALKEKNT